MEDLIRFLEENSLTYTITYTPQSMEFVYTIVVDKGFARGTGSTLMSALEETVNDIKKSIQKRKELLGI